jgi:daunorubicin resistance ABC transporter ATP-binding subunit
MTDTAIHAQALEKNFGDVRALAGLDLSVQEGTIYGLLGPNGAGKTTAVRIFTTIIAPDAGMATVLGYDVVRDADAVRERIGLAGQYAAVDENLTGSENLRLVGKLSHLDPKVIRPRADELLERFDLTEAANRPVKTYSGGMRRRLDVAAALVHRPPVLFLDEPTTGLDPAGRTELWGVISDLVRDGSTVLLTTQYLEEADRLANRVAVVDHGKVIAEGTPSQLKSRMGATVLELTYPSKAKAVKAAKALERVGPRDPILDGSIVELAVTDGSKFVVDVLRKLDRSKLAPAGMALREPSLDDVFLTLTGQRATTDEIAAGPEGNGSEPATRRKAKGKPKR